MDRSWKASTVEDYRSILRVHHGRPITPRTKNKILNVLSGVFSRARKVWRLPENPRLHWSFRACGADDPVGNVPHVRLPIAGLDG